MTQGVKRVSSIHEDGDSTTDILFIEFEDGSALEIRGYLERETGKRGGDVNIVIASSVLSAGQIKEQQEYYEARGHKAIGCPNRVERSDYLRARERERVTASRTDCIANPREVVPT